jgi:hypothetical protein
MNQTEYDEAMKLHNSFIIHFVAREAKHFFKQLTHVFGYSPPLFNFEKDKLITTRHQNGVWFQMGEIVLCWDEKHGFHGISILNNVTHYVEANKEIEQWLQVWLHHPYARLTRA